MKKWKIKTDENLIIECRLQIYDICEYILHKKYIIILFIVSLFNDISLYLGTQPDLNNSLIIRD